jgi:hypothetical protein
MNTNNQLSCIHFFIKADSDELNLSAYDLTEVPSGASWSSTEGILPPFLLPLFVIIDEDDDDDDDDEDV